MKNGRNKAGAFTLVELMVAVGIVALTGAGVFAILRTGLILFAKNTAINVTHQQGRYGLAQLQGDLYNAVSVPQLVDNTGAVVASPTGPAAGVSFRAFAGGPFVLAVPAGSVINGTSTSIQVITGTLGSSVDYKPIVGQRLHIQVLPTAPSEKDITAVSAPSTTGSGTVYTLSFASALGSDITVRNPGDNSPLNVACFITTPVSYIVQNGQLVCSTLTSSGPVTNVMARNINAAVATPFSVPTINGSPNYTYVAVSNFSLFDASSTNRGYGSTMTSFSLQTPHYSQLTTSY